MNKTSEEIAQALETLGVKPQHLDDLVHEAASVLASSLTNHGLIDQIKFLRLQGFNTSDILREIKVE